MRASLYNRDNWRQRLLPTSVYNLERATALGDLVLNY